MNSEAQPNLCYNISSYIGFAMLCFLYGTSYGIAILGLKHYPGATLIALRMEFAFGTSVLIFLIRSIIDRNLFNTACETLCNNKIDMLKSAFGGIMYYGFPHSLIGVAQRTIASNTVHIAQSCVPFFAFIFANFLLPDEKFSCHTFYPQVLAVIGTTLTTIPTMESPWHETPSVWDYIFLFVAIASFGFGSVYMKSGLANVEPNMCGIFQLFGSAIFSTCFALGYDKPKVFAKSISESTGVTILWPLILGSCHTCGCTYVYLWVVKRLGAVISSFSNFGQIVLGVLIGVIFFQEWANYKTKDFILSGLGLGILCLAIICGFLGPTPKNQVPNIQKSQSFMSDEGILLYTGE